MKALQIIKYGELKDSLAINEVNKPAVQAKDVLIAVKAGLVGVLVFVFWHIKIFYLGLKTIKWSRYSLHLLALTVFSIISTFFMSGIFEANDWSSLLIVFGMLISHAHNLERRLKIC